MIFVDPPYLLSDGGFTCSGGERTSVDKGDCNKPEKFQNDVEFHKKWISLCRRVLKNEVRYGLVELII